MVQTRQSLRENLQTSSGGNKTKNSQVMEPVSLEPKDSITATVFNDKNTCSEEKYVEMDTNKNNNNTVKEINKKNEKVLRVEIRDKSPSDVTELRKERQDSTHQETLSKNNELEDKSKRHLKDITEKAIETAKKQNQMLNDDPENNSISMSEIDEDINEILTEIEEDNASIALNLEPSNVNGIGETFSNEELINKLGDVKEKFLTTDVHSKNFTKNSRNIKCTDSTVESGTLHCTNTEADLCVIVDPPLEVVYVSDDSDIRFKDKNHSKKVTIDNAEKIDQIDNKAKGSTFISKVKNSSKTSEIKTKSLELQCDVSSKINQTNIMETNYIQKNEVKTLNKNEVTTEKCVSKIASIGVSHNEFTKSTQPPLKPTTKLSGSNKNNVLNGISSQARAVSRSVIQLPPDADIGGMPDKLSFDNSQEVLRNDRGIKKKRTNDYNFEQLPLSKKAKTISNSPIVGLNKDNADRSTINPGSTSSSNRGQTTMNNTNSILNSNKSVTNSRRTLKRRQRRRRTAKAREGMNRKNAQQIVSSYDTNQSSGNAANVKQHTPANMSRNLQQNQRNQNMQTPNPHSLIPHQVKEYSSSLRKQKSSLSIELNQITNKTTQPKNQGITGQIMENISAPSLPVKMQLGEHLNSNEAHTQCGKLDGSFKIAIVHALHPICILTQVHINQIKRSLLFEIDNTKNIKTNLGFFDCTTKDGGLVLTCNHSETKNWVIKIIDTLKPFPQGSLRAIEENAQPKYLCLLHLSQDDVMPFLQLLLRLEKQNHNLSTKNWQMLKSVPDLDLSKKLIFSIDELSKKRILAQGGKLFLNFGQINVKIMDKNGQTVIPTSTNNDGQNIDESPLNHTSENSDHLLSYVGKPTNVSTQENIPNESSVSNFSVNTSLNGTYQTSALFPSSGEKEYPFTGKQNLNKNTNHQTQLPNPASFSLIEKSNRKKFAKNNIVPQGSYDSRNESFSLNKGTNNIKNTNNKNLNMDNSQIQRSALGFGLNPLLSVMNILQSNSSNSVPFSG